MDKFSLIDVSTAVYMTYFRCYRNYNPNRPEEVVVKYLKQQLLALIEPAIQPGYYPVLLFDCKQNGVYWRQNFIDNHAAYYSELWANPKTGNGMNAAGAVNDEKYKGGRLKSTDYNPILKLTWIAARQLAEQYVCFEEPGLEADDFAGLLVAYKPDNVSLDLVTVDRDWAMLLRNETIRFIDLYPKRRYQIEYTEDAVKYFQNKIHSSIETPEEAAYWKAKLGEKSDNCLPGSHVELVDLVNHAAPISYGFQDAHDRVINFFSNPQSSALFPRS